MHLEAKETARLYKLLTDKLGSDTTEAMFKYIDSKTERSVENNIQALATKTDLFLVKDEIYREIGSVRQEISDVRRDLGETKADMIKWMFIFWIGQVGATLAIVLLFLKK